MTTALIILVVCAGAILYTYVLYPLLVTVLSHLFPRPPLCDAAFTPSVSMIVAAYNEAAVIDEKIQNCLNLDYRRDRIEFLVGSDGSTDGTDDQLSTCRDDRVRPFLFPERRGKTRVLNAIVPDARGEVLVFSDANTMYQPDAVRRLVSHLADPDVGGVCGRLRLMKPADAAGDSGEGLYWRYENAIKRAEGALDTVVGANGAIYAIRRPLFRPLPTRSAVMDDFLIPLSVVEQGKRVTYEPNALATENASPSVAAEFGRKLRIAAANFNGLPHVVGLLNPLRGFVAWALWSHKVLRWLVPFLAFGAFVANARLLGGGWPFAALFGAQLIIYAAALGGFLADRYLGGAGPLVPFMYFGMVNLALVAGLWRSLTGSQPAAWRRVER